VAGLNISQETDMHPVKEHRPGRPKSKQPPGELEAIIDRLRTDVPDLQSGMTTTADGRWGIWVGVPAKTAVPIQSVETAARGFPVVYEEVPGDIRPLI
jgi:hypothetical protein